jgi:hypothetical protein
MSLQTRITALVQAIGADIKALYSGKVGTSDARLTDAREWTATTVTQAEAEAGIATTRRAWTAQRVFQAIAAWWAASAMKTKLDGIATGATANATDAQLRDRSTHTGTQAISTVSGLQTALDGKISTTERGVSGGIPTLDAFARIPASQLPSYVDDVLEYLTLSAFPATGETGKIYIAINQGTAANPTRQYRWTGSVYAEINPSPGTTDALTEGSTNLYFNESRVRSTVLTGLSLASSAAVAATDNVLAAFGKIQARINLLGTAANANTQTSPTDTTPGALMAVGAFGVGGIALGAGVSDLNQLVTPGRWRDDGGVMANRPPGFPFGEVIVGGYLSDYESQTYCTTDGRRAFRARAAGEWGMWREIFHTGNLVKQTSPTDTTAGALMAVGAFGWNGGVTQGLSDANTIKTPGAYSIYQTANAPYAFGNLLSFGWGADSSWVTELALQVNGSGLAYRSARDAVGGFGGWNSIFHTGNFDPATKQDKSSLVATATSRTLTITDAWNYVRPGTTSAITLTVPTNASVAFDIGTEITVRALGNVTLASASGVTLNAPSGGTRSMTASMTVTLKKVATNEWDVIGQTVAA